MSVNCRSRTSRVNAADQVRRFYGELWGIPDLEVLPEIVHPDFTFRGSLGTQCRGRDEFADYVTAVTSALAEYECKIEQLVEQADVVVARMTFSGLHQARLLGV